MSDKVNFFEEKMMHKQVFETYLETYFCISSSTLLARWPNWYDTLGTRVHGKIINVYTQTSQLRLTLKNSCTCVLIGNAKVDNMVATVVYDADI